MTDPKVVTVPGVTITPPAKVYWMLTRRDGSSYAVDQTEYDRLRSLQVRKFVSARPARSHTCSVCGHEGPWTDEWAWFGSYRDVDEDRPVKKFCSDACRKGRRGFAAEDDA